MTASITGIDLGFSPWIDNGFAGLDEHMTRDDALLDALAQEYGASVADPSMEEFLLTWTPRRLFDIGYAGVVAPDGLDLGTDDGIKRLLWLGHVIGWNVGVFARTAFRLGGVPPIATVDLTPDVLAGTVACADRARAAAFGADPDVLAFNLRSVYGDLAAGPLPPFPEMVLVGPGLGVGEVPWYAYDLGFIDSICTTNRPAAVPEEPDYVTYGDTDGSAAGLLDARWKIGDAPFLEATRARFDALATAPDSVRARFTDARRDPNETGEASKELRALQDRFVEQGKLIWSGPPFPGPNVTAFSVENYHFFRTASAYYVQYNQANAMAALVAYATEDASLGRVEAALSGAFHFLIDNSITGVFDPKSDAQPTMADALPTFTS